MSVHGPIGISRLVSDLATSPIGDDWDWIIHVKKDTWQGHWIGKDIHKKQTDTDLVILYFHGGGFTYGHSTMYMPTFKFIIDQLYKVHGVDTRILSVNYSLSPEHPWPKASNECLDAYRYLINEAGIDSSRVILAGDSAGGNLVATTLLNIKNSKDNTHLLSMPAGGVLVSPWIDITPKLPGFNSSKCYDVISPLHIDFYTHNYIPNFDTLVQSERDAYLKNPFVSPFYGDYRDVCPLLITFGDREILNESISTFIQRLLKDGCNVDTIEGKSSHIWMIFPLMADNKQHFEQDCLKMISWIANRYKQSIHRR